MKMEMEMEKGMEEEVHWEIVGSKRRICAFHDTCAAFMTETTGYEKID